VLSLRTSYLKLLDGVFTLIKAELDRCEDELSEKQIETAEQLATYWSSHLVTIRKQLYQEAIESTKKEPEVRFQVDALKYGDSSLSLSNRSFRKSR
jgi:hypothetical protein